MPHHDCDEAWTVAYAIQERVAAWLAFHDLPQPRASIIETDASNPRPETFTFVAHAGLLEESVRLPANILRWNSKAPDLYAQCVADYLYRLLVRN